MQRCLWALAVAALVLPTVRLSAEEGNLLALNEGASAQQAALAELTKLAFTRETERPGDAAYGPDPGDWEMILTGTGSNDSDFDNGAGGVTFSLGYFFTEEMEVSFRQTLNFRSISGGDSDFNGSSRVAFDWNFDLGRFRPFVGVNLGVVYGDDIDTSFLLSPEVGVKYYIIPKAFLFGMIEYQWPTKESFSNDSIWVYTVGVGLNF